MTTVMLTGVIDGVVKFCDPIGRFRLSGTKEEANLYKKRCSRWLYVITSWWTQALLRRTAFHVPESYTLKGKCCNFDEIFVIDCTGSCHSITSGAATDENFAKITTYSFNVDNFPSLCVFWGALKSSCLWHNRDVTCGSWHRLLNRLFNSVMLTTRKASWLGINPSVTGFLPSKRPVMRKALFSFYI